MPSNVNEILAYANIQMAAEALYGLASEQPEETFSGELLIQERQEFLTDGNERVSRFTALQATEFAQIWEVVEHTSNSTTGFSGTLFQVRTGAPAELLQRYGLAAGEQVLSFRSTEFADDAARDNQATNVLEVKEFG